MFSVNIRTPKRHRGFQVVVRPGEVVLLGREPSFEKIAANGIEVPDGARRVELIKDDPKVSGNHALLWREGDDLCALDLDSRHGSVVRISAGTVVRLHHATTVFLVELAGTADEEPSLFCIEGEPDWLSPARYAETMCRFINQWLSRTTQDGCYVALDDQPDDTRVAFRLADGSAMHLHWRTTQLPAASSLTSAIHDFVRRQNRRWLADQQHEGPLVLASPAMRERHAAIRRAAEQDACPLILGGPGTGKGVLARCFHLHSPRRKGPFVRVDCATTPDLTSSIEAADGGTLFLDGIEALSLAGQSAVVTLIDTSSYRRADKVTTLRPADVRLVFASRSVRSALQLKLHPDLWWRIDARALDLPPLADRSEDIVAYLETRPCGDGLMALDVLHPEALARLLRYPWPGGFHDLDAFCTHTLAGARRGSVDAQSCDAALLDMCRARAARVLCVCAPEDASHLQALEAQLAPLERAHTLEFWHEGRASAGADLQRETREHLERADVVVLLVSSSFFASKRCVDDLMIPALAREQSEEARVVVVKVREVNLPSTLAQRQLLPRGGKPVTSWKDKDAAWAQVTSELNAVVASLRMLRC